MAHIALANDTLSSEGCNVRPSRAANDVIFGMLAFFVLVCLLSAVDFSKQLFGFGRQNENLKLDVWAASISAFGAVAIWFAFRRWRDAQSLNVQLTEASLEIEETYRKLRRAETQCFEVERQETFGRLAAGFSHELNNMLQPSVMLTQLVLQKESLSEESKKNLIAVLDACRRSQDVLERTMMVVCAEQPVREKLRLAEALEQAIDLAKPLLPNSVFVSTEIKRTSKLVLIDEVELSQLMTNLLRNGAQAVSSHGRIDVRLSLETTVDELGGPNALLSGEYLKISVSDNGCGMAENTRERIFDPFFTAFPRYETSTECDDRNVGLGLSIVHGIVSRWGGWISVRSEVGAGSCFEIFLPAFDA